MTDLVHELVTDAAHSVDTHELPMQSTVRQRIGRVDRGDVTTVYGDPEAGGLDDRARRPQPGLVDN